MAEEFHDYAIEREHARQWRKEFEDSCKETWKDFKEKFSRICGKSRQAIGTVQKRFVQSQLFGSVAV
jgi:hypothetical protein